MHLDDDDRTACFTMKKHMSASDLYSAVIITMIPACGHMGERAGSGLLGERAANGWADGRRTGGLMGG